MSSSSDEEDFNRMKNRKIKDRLLDRYGYLLQDPKRKDFAEILKFLESTLYEKDFKETCSKIEEKLQDLEAKEKREKQVGQVIDFINLCDSSDDEQSNQMKKESEIPRRNYTKVRKTDDDEVNWDPIRNWRKPRTWPLQEKKFKEQEKKETKHVLNGFNPTLPPPQPYCQAQPSQAYCIVPYPSPYQVIFQPPILPQHYVPPNMFQQNIFPTVAAAPPTYPQQTEPQPSTSGYNHREQESYRNSDNSSRNNRSQSHIEDPIKQKYAEHTAPSYAEHRKRKAQEAALRDPRKNSYSSNYRDRPNESRMQPSNSTHKSPNDSTKRNHSFETSTQMSKKTRDDQHKTRWSEAAPKKKGDLQASPNKTCNSYPRNRINPPASTPQNHIVSPSVPASTRNHIVSPSVPASPRNHITPMIESNVAGTGNNLPQTLTDNRPWKRPLVASSSKVTTSISPRALNAINGNDKTIPEIIVPLKMPIPSTSTTELPATLVQSESLDLMPFNQIKQETFTEEDKRILRHSIECKIECETDSNHDTDVDSNADTDVEDDPNPLPTSPSVIKAEVNREDELEEDLVMLQNYDVRVRNIQELLGDHYPAQLPQPMAIKVEVNVSSNSFDNDEEEIIPYLPPEDVELLPHD